MTYQAAESASNRIHDELAPRYGYAVDANLAAQLKYRLVLRHLPPDARVLDVGCANGLHLRVVAPHCREIVGVDINPRMLELARRVVADQRIANARVCEMNTMDLAFADATFDLAYCLSTLLLVGDVERAVGEIGRVLRQGGIAVLDITGRLNLSQRHWGRWYRMQGHPGVRAFSWRGVEALLRSAGLQVSEAPALGFLDQWKYLPLLRRAFFLDRVIHPSPARDLDFAVSNLPGVRHLANRWYVVARKRS